MISTQHLFIDGDYRAGEVGVSDIHNPFTDEVIGSVSYASEKQMRSAVDAAVIAFTDRRMPSKERSDILLAVAELIKSRKEEFAKTITAESAKPITYSRIEVDRAIFTIEASSKAAIGVDETIAIDTMGAPNAVGKEVGVRYFPAGVVVAITPFNFPLNLVVHKIAPAIACGCPVVLKPAPQTPLTSFLLADVFQEAGLPKGWLNVVPCENEVAEKLVADERVKVVSFTGSAAVGWKLKSLVPKKKVTLELGGNGAVIVDEIKDWDKLISSLCTAAFYYAGQVCISLQRLYVARHLFNELLSRFIDAAAKLRVGDPMRNDVVVGPLISEAAAKKAWSWIGSAINKGAVKHIGEFQPPNFISPTIMTNVPQDCDLSCEEVFAPVVIVELYDTLDEAIKKVNSTRYGLQAGVFTADETKIRQAYEQLEVGGVIINDTNTFRIDTMPYGGVKDSGFGREGVNYAMQEMCEVRVLARPA